MYTSSSLSLRKGLDDEAKLTSKSQTGLLEPRFCTLSLTQIFFGLSRFVLFPSNAASSTSLFDGIFLLNLGGHISISLRASLWFN